MNFTGHNILLDNGQMTMGTKEILMANSLMWRAIEKTVNLFIPLARDERSKLRVVDLGCLEGGYTVQFARMGFDTLGIEAREENIQKCNYVKSNLSYSNLNFVHDDVRNLSKYGKFDITFCSGVLYHLNDPIQFLRTVSTCTSKLLLLNTHFTREKDLRYDFGALNSYLIDRILKRIKKLKYRKNYRLSIISQSEGYRGRWYKEWKETEKKDKIEKMVWASYNNNKSFWLCKKDLTKALHDVGFDSVFEQFDFTGDLVPEDFIESHDR